MTKETPRPPRHNPLIDTAEDLALGVGRFGYGLLSWGLGLLPSQSRQHMHNAIRELSYGFASLPRDFAEIAGSEIERWAEEDDEGRTGHAGSQTLGASDLTASVAPVNRLTANLAPPVGAAAPATSPALVTRLTAPLADPPTGVLPTGEVSADAVSAEEALADAVSTREASAEEALADAVSTREASAEVASANAVSAGEAGAVSAGNTPVTPVSTTTGITISHLEYNPPGRDIDGEYVQITNSTTESVDLAGWSLHDGNNRHSFTFPRFRLAPGASVKVWTRQGRNDQANLYWGRRSAIWNNDGDTGTLKDAAGRVVSSYSYVGNEKRKRK